MITALAVVGSAARRATDRWSDVDLALRLAPHVDPMVAADGWEALLRSSHDVVDHLDLWSGAALYRVFLLADSLQVDVSFWPSDTFASNGEPFELIFGEANDPTEPGPSDPRDVIGWAWLYALHARTAIARRRPWQALHMIDGLRDRVVSLACARHGLPAYQGRGVDALPAPLLSRLSSSLVAAPDVDLLSAAFALLVRLLEDEAHEVDLDQAARLRPVFDVLIRSAVCGPRSPPPTGSEP